ncbi:MAG: hypothetical protein M3Y82_14315 [Verrucomicrobiota bacterium]|nr:hypothetical protein [Verrucomicrobiota bacterium]
MPLIVFPPGFDTNNLKIFEVEKSKSQTKSEWNSPMNLTSGGCDCPSMGFFRVFHIPDFPASITNYTFDGPIFIPVDFKDYMDRVDNIEVLLNGQPTDYAEFTTYISGGETNWGMAVYFDRVTNGTYQIQLRSTLRLNDEIDDNTPYLVLSDLIKSIVVANQVTFPDWNDLIQGDTYTFNAKTANPNTDWSFDIFDALGNYVNTGSGHTTNGEISWTWNLNDYLGNNRDDFETDPYFYSEITFDSAGNGPTITRPTPPPVKGYPDRGEWIISFQDRWYSDAPAYPADLQGKYEEAIDAVWGGPLLIGDNAIPFPLKFGTNVYSQAERDQTWTNLLTRLGDLHVRNFYYHGHGGASSLGADRHTFDTNGLVTGSALEPNSKAFITIKQAKKNIGVNRFRFIFLDGCSTSAGDWPSTFGIGKATNSVADYQNDPRHRRPSVFVGWNQTVGGTGWGNAYNRLDFQSFWMGNWVNDSPRPTIVAALNRANLGAGWVAQDKLDSALRVYGYRDMRALDYNRKGDWRWP